MHLIWRTQVPWVFKKKNIQTSWFELNETVKTRSWAARLIRAFIALFVCMENGHFKKLQQIHSYFIHLFLWFLPYFKSCIFFHFPYFLLFLFPFQLIYGSNFQENQECVCHQHGKNRLLELTDTVCVDSMTQWPCMYVSLNNGVVISHCVLMDQKGSFAQCI